MHNTESNTDTDINTTKNIIYTGVAGTGKTYRLLQIAKRYTYYSSITDRSELLAQLLYERSWREVLCLIFLDLKAKSQDLVKVPELLAHEFFLAKAAQNERDKNLSNTAWLELRRHSPIDSKTVSCENRASQAYFDKDASGAWYLLPSSLVLLNELTQQLTDFKEAQRNDQPLKNQCYSMVSFHQAYGYEEFVEGIRPVMSGHIPSEQASRHDSAGQMRYDIQDGAFLQLCQRAARDPEQRYAILIDEINRANVARVFGELLSLIEPDKRAGQPNEMQANLAYSGRSFSVPSNVDIYATMNTQDHSLAPLDMALRRRFRFIHCPPQPELLPTIDVLKTGQNKVESDKSSATIDLAKLLAGLNQRISQTLGAEAQLGHAFLWSVHSIVELQTALVEQIIPQLAQAAGGQVALLQYIFHDNEQPTDAQFIHDHQAHLAQQPSQHGTTAQDSMFDGQTAFLGSAMPAGDYTINPDLIADTGKFAQAFIYQRLYL
ncbi:McrB family protein [uncultured Psychrobacter sp.]|uniref:McrB family protein n=1 Tax=uncultured Psychrobacter sp. TaxID=259303 RepID=UPI003459C283